MTLAEVASAVSGRLIGPAEARVAGQAHTDSREVAPGDLFFARRGESTDGHLYAGQAVAQGAAVLIVERELDVAAAEGEHIATPQIVVADATLALGALAAHNVRRAKEGALRHVVGVTGSNGKTTTKNLIAAMAEKLGPTVSNIRSFNNEVGGPVTMLRVSEETRTLVSEMGANAEGDIEALVQMARPNIGVVLAVGLAHAGGFGSIETTFRTKSEMVRELPESAVAVLNRDDPWVSKMAELTSARVVWFGQHQAADVRASDVDGSASGTEFTLHARGESLPVRFRVLGEHHVSNALAATAVALELGMSLTQIVEVLEAATVAAPGRMQPFAGRDGITVIDDAYNANPDSMSAALKTLARIRKPNGRSVAVLGAMAELGELAGEQHDRLGLQVVRLGISELVVVGAEARRLHISSINEGSWDGESVYFEESAEALRYLADTVRPNDTVLVKASNSAGLQRLAGELAAILAPETTDAPAHIVDAREEGRA